MFVDSYLKNAIKHHLHGDARRFDELWTSIPDFGHMLRTFDTDSAWLHWSPKTFDGWYCVPGSSGYEVYFQERGHVDQRWHFPSEQAAVRFAVDAAVFPLPTRPDTRDQPFDAAVENSFAFFGLYSGKHLSAKLHLAWMPSAWSRTLCSMEQPKICRFLLHCH